MQEEMSCCAADSCKVQTDAREEPVLATEILRRIECKLEEFVEAVEAVKDLEIDGLSIDDVPCQEVTDKSRIKVLNHKGQYAVEVEIDTIIKTPLHQLIRALVTGETQHVYGVTRIVGYYSRVQNWNKSKIGELQDRHKGNYGVKQG